MGCKITAGVVNVCPNRLIAGVDDELLLANKEDISAVVEDIGNELILSSISMATGTQFFKWEGQNNSIEPLQTLVRTRYQRVWDHEARFKAFTNSDDIKKEIAQMASGLFVGIIKNKSGKYEVYGLDVGLELLEASRNPLDIETGGSWDLFLKTPEDINKEPLPVRTFFDTDAATTEAAILALLSPAP